MQLTQLREFFLRNTFTFAQFSKVNTDPSEQFTITFFHENKLLKIDFAINSPMGCQSIGVWGLKMSYICIRDMTTVVFF
jgi:hypothetical protein